MRASALAALALLAVICTGCEEQRAPAAPAPASLSGEGTVRRGVGPECADTWSVETAERERLWPVTDPELQKEGLRVRFEAHGNEGFMSTCMAGMNVRFTRLEAEGETAPGGAGIWNTAWRLVELDGAAVIEDAEATLEFPEEGRAAGRGTCNRFFAIVAVEGDSIRFSGIGSTRMACEEPLAGQEAKYLKALESAERFAIEGDALVIHAQGMAAPLRFTRASP
jgi:heat shock protein HslJ